MGKGKPFPRISIVINHHFVIDVKRKNKASIELLFPPGDTILETANALDIEGKIICI